jgi:hypothetical protein
MVRSIKFNLRDDPFLKNRQPHPPKMSQYDYAPEDASDEYWRQQYEDEDRDEIMSHMLLDSSAYDMLKEFFENNEQIYKSEIYIHGIDPLDEYNKYFKQELEEPIYEEIVSAVVDNLGVMSAPIVQQWIDLKLAKGGGDDDDEDY